VTGSSDGPSTTRAGRTDSPRSPLAPPCFNFSGRRQIELTWQEIPTFSAIYRVLGPTRRGDGVLHFLSINRTLIRLRLEDFWKRMNFGLVTGWKPNFPAGLTRLRKIPYLKLVHRVWLG
jgi:hypothetical protein